jgi:hypothetical protein
LQLDPETADSVWAELVRKDGTNNTLARWYDIGNIMCNEDPESNMIGTNVAESKSGQLLMAATKQYYGQDVAPSGKDLLSILTMIDFALEDCRSVKATSTSGVAPANAEHSRPHPETTNEVQGAEDEVNVRIQ